MSVLRITLEIDSTIELEALTHALDLYAESERERIKDEPSQDPTEHTRELARVAGATKLLKRIG